MKVLVLGCNGQLGCSLTDTAPEEAEVIGLDLPDIDITDAAAILELCRESKPDIVINAAAYTAVDKAESEQELAASVNVEGARNIAIASRAIDAKLIHISTDYVFDGKSSTPYRPDAKINPINVYGQTKRDGELAVLEETAGSGTVIRTSWLYSKYGQNFVKTMLRLMKEKDEIGVVSDQFGAPTWASSLAKVVWAFASEHKHSGVFHWSDGGNTSWYEFAVAIQEEGLERGLLTRAIPISPLPTTDYKTIADRPMYTVLDSSTSLEALNIESVNWRVNLRQMLDELATDHS